MSAKLLLDTLMLVDGGKVECSVAAPDGTVVRGVIEQSFFEDFTGLEKPVLTPPELGRIIQGNLAYFEKRAEEEWQAGSRELSIR